NARRQQYNNRDSSSRPQNGGASSSSNQATQEQRYPVPTNSKQAINILNRFAVDKNVDIGSLTTKKVYYAVSKKIHPDRNIGVPLEETEANFKVLGAVKELLENERNYNITPFNVLIGTHNNLRSRNPRYTR
ncbi:MAG: J domain-containing protein, partial [Pseudomonadota bacterium]|nr:J domain-containing protein [Pseudomonadota bacterium]